jgi:hypothetical protein
MEGYSPEHTIWNTIHPISPLFPNNFVVFGDAGCDRLSLPLPFSSCTPTDPPMTADSHEFTAKCIIELSTMAKQVKAGDRLIVLLIGHGSPGDGVFRLHITTKPNDIIAEAYITKSTLEFILKDCRGEVLLICNSCYSGLLASHLWTLLCAADSNELADALSESGSGHFRGSSFTACALAQVAQEHGLQYPLPRAVPRSGPPGQEVPLPLSPPRHSFPTSVTLTTISRPSDISSLETFFQLMRETERFLTIGAENIFQVSGALSTVTWTSVLTFQFNAEILNRIQPVPESEDFQKRFNDRLQSSNLQGGGAGGSVLPTTMRRPISPLLVRLVKAIPSFEHGPPPRTQEGLFAEIYHQLARHVAHPELYASPLEVHKIGEDELIYRLLPMHVQAIAVQQIASELGWHYIVDAVVMPFLPFVWSMDKFQLEEMIEHGVLVKDVAEYLRVNHFHE